MRKRVDRISCLHVVLQHSGCDIGHFICFHVGLQHPDCDKVHFFIFPSSFHWTPATCNFFKMTYFFSWQGNQPINAGIPLLYGFYCVGTIWLAVSYIHRGGEDAPAEWLVSSWGTAYHYRVALKHLLDGVVSLHRVVTNGAVGKGQAIHCKKG